MILLRLVLIGLIASVLAGCATLIDVTNRGDQTVKIDGTAYMFARKPDVFKSVIKRAAEIVKEKQFRYFTVTMLKPYDPYAVGNITLEKVDRVSMLISFVENKESDDPTIFDAQYIIDNLSK